MTEVGERAKGSATPSSLLTFLLADVRGYTTYSAEHGDQAAAQLSERFLSLCREVVSTHGGEVFGSAGDQALAAFTSTHAALFAALALQSRLGEEQQTHSELPLQAGIGLDAGEGIRIGSDYRGNALNLAARLCSLAGPGEIFASEQVVRIARTLEGLAMVDRGEVTLKGLPAPVRVIQIGPEGSLPDELPPLQPILVTHPTNLPDAPTPFIGRQREVDSITRLLRDPHVRLLTLTGPGGTGKTRLALQVGTTLLDDFPDGVFFCDLSALTDPALVPSAIAQGLEVKEQPGRSLIETLIAALQAKHLLLVLDNFEQVVAAGVVVGELLDACRNLHLLVTSRIPLHLSREHEHAVPPLSLPDPQQGSDAATLSQYESVALFIERAKAAKDTFAMTDENAPAVAEICTRLDGLPLAIELAAARIKLFPPQALLQRLDDRLKLLTGGARDRPNRQQTLRGTIDWSYQLLTEEERVLFARMSVFAGGFTLDAVEAICNADGNLGIDPIDGIASLMEKSLVRQLEDDAADEPRFGLLETIREYAGEKLAESGEAESVRRLHLQFFTELAGTAYAGRTGETDVGRAVDRLAPENDNFTAALRWALERRDAPSVLRLAGYVGWYWGRRGLWHSAQLWAEAALSITPPGRFPAERGLLLFNSGRLAAVSGETEAGIARILEAERLLEDAGESRSAMQARIFAGMYMGASGDTERAIEYLERGLAQAREGGDAWAVATALTALAYAAVAGDNAPLARRRAEEATAALPADGDQFSFAQAYNVLGDAFRLEEKHEEARGYYERSLALTRDAGWSGMIPSMQHNLAWTLHGMGEDEGAIGLFTSTLRAFQRMGDTRGVAECLVGLACSVSQPEIAAQLFAAGCSLLEEHNAKLSRPNQQAYDRESGRVRSVLGDEAWQAAWAEGAGLTPDQALALVASTPPA